MPAFTAFFVALTLFCGVMWYVYERPAKKTVPVAVDGQAPAPAPPAAPVKKGGVDPRPIKGVEPLPDFSYKPKPMTRGLFEFCVIAFLLFPSIWMIIGCFIGGSLAGDGPGALAFLFLCYLASIVIYYVLRFMFWPGANEFWGVIGDLFDKIF